MTQRGTTANDHNIFLWEVMHNVHQQLNNMIQPRPSVCATMISLGLMINAGMLLASSRRLIFGGPVIVLRLTRKSFNYTSQTMQQEPSPPSPTAV